MFQGSFLIPYESVQPFYVFEFSDYQFVEFRFMKYLKTSKVGKERISPAQDTSLPRIAFISDRLKKERNPKIIEMVFHLTITSGTSNVTKDFG